MAGLQLAAYSITNPSPVLQYPRGPNPKVPSPSLTLGFILATLYGAAFHVVVGGDARRLAFFLIAGWLGFALGQTFGAAFGIDVFNIGSLHTASATFGAILALFAARLFTGRRSS